jgi:hypothetical protein
MTRHSGAYQGSLRLPAPDHDDAADCQTDLLSVRMDEKNVLRALPPSAVARFGTECRHGAAQERSRASEASLRGSNGDAQDVCRRRGRHAANVTQQKCFDHGPRQLSRQRRERDEKRGIAFDVEREILGRRCLVWVVTPGRLACPTATTRPAVAADRVQAHLPHVAVAARAVTTDRRHRSFTAQDFHEDTLHRVFGIRRADPQPARVAKEGFSQLHPRISGPHFTPSLHAPNATLSWLATRTSSIEHAFAWRAMGSEGRADPP